jgi:hypothetical protein
MSLDKNDVGRTFDDAITRIVNSCQKLLSGRNVEVGQSYSFTDDAACSDINWDISSIYSSLEDLESRLSYGID